ncbi:Sirohydrochlorin cobaltochelatase [Candidatus Methanobinarius endosymbioticus]|uniref:Sirohydrochlorin cobaltochelatase n=1 Tax=Candidatus Methanobinarius endosymbioticus TaxID=2006182 RepID=A0A366M9A7_9EURY|nr:Sirohydrochlorin cobaltochelatase [Candidatus Methanobinarius endosymbioticus]
MKKMIIIQKNTGVQLISHGSRLPAPSETINALTDMYRKETDFRVEVGYMEIHKTHIPHALNQLVEGTEINTVIPVPVFLAHGMHTTRDIPKILKLDNKNDKEENEDIDNSHNHSNHHEKEEDHHHSEKNESHDTMVHHHHDFEKIDFDGKIIYTEPFGADHLVLEIIKNRVNSAIDNK